MYAGILHLGRRLPRPIERNPEQLATRSVPVSCRRKPFAGPTVQRRLTGSAFSQRQEAGRRGLLARRAAP